MRIRRSLLRWSAVLENRLKLLLFIRRKHTLDLNKVHKIRVSKRYLGNCPSDPSQAFFEPKLGEDGTAGKNFHGNYSVLIDMKEDLIILL